MLKKHVSFRPGFDRRHDPKGNYGINGGMFLFAVSGPEGAVSFSISPNFFPETALEHIATVNGNDARACFNHWGPRGILVAHHTLTPQYEGQKSEACDLLDGKPCYCDGSYTRADEWMTNFMEDGTDWLWPAMEAEYAALFPQLSETIS